MQSFNIQDCILYEDKDILVCHKPAGVAVQSARLWNGRYGKQP